MRWTAGELFDAPRNGRPSGLVWRLKGERVDALARIACASRRGGRSNGAHDGSTATTRAASGRVEARSKFPCSARIGASWLETGRYNPLDLSHSNSEIASGRITADTTDERRGRLRLELGELDQRIELIAVARHYGGRQWYFVCPQTGRRASVLWKPPGARAFASRQAWGRQVAYASQFKTGYDRACSAAWAIKYRLGGADYSDFAGELPPKPRGMHWRTYEKETSRLETYENACNFYLLRYIARLL